MLKDSDSGKLLSPFQWFHKHYSPRLRNFKQHHHTPKYILVEEETEIDMERYEKLTATSDQEQIVADALDNSVSRAKRQSHNFSHVTNHKCPVNSQVSFHLINCTLQHTHSFFLTGFVCAASKRTLRTPAQKAKFTLLSC